MTATIVDYWSGGQTANTHVRRYLEHLGFDVREDHSQTQDDVACGYVAARVFIREVVGEASGTPIASDKSWITNGNVILAQMYKDVMDEADRDSSSPVESIRKDSKKKKQVARCRRRDFLRAGDGSIFIRESEILYLVRQWVCADARCNVSGVDTRDGTLHDIAADVYHAVTSESHALCSQPIYGVESCERRVRVCNTDMSTSGGNHWFTVIYSIQWRGVSAPTPSGCSAVNVDVAHLADAAGEGSRFVRSEDSQEEQELELAMAQSLPNVAQLADAAGEGSGFVRAGDSTEERALQLALAATNF